ncbi:substrate-binding domain-containing protein [Casimicrobium huifangae]|jgi:molybdate transport system substrate-binding protein|uniref:substrate-binding domain-containing protein n=1 Tax=Casimicrobium huifangae TaxID=2591109 RepID=UPI0037846CFA
MQPILTLRRKALRGALGLLGLGAATLLAACATAPAPTPAPRSAEIRVITSGAFTEAYKQLVPLFERESGHKVISSFGASMGNAPDAIPTRLARGEQFDIIILAGPALDGFIKEGKAVAGSRVDLVRSTIGFAVKSGAPKPDISTVPKLKQTLLDAKSIAYSASASGTYFSTELVQKLGIAEQVLPKSKRILSERVGTVVARGDAELGLQQVSELVPIPGIDYIGPLPDEVQQATFFSAGIVTGAKEPEAARALIKFFTSAKAAPVIAKTGLEPVGSK